MQHITEHLYGFLTRFGFVNYYLIENEGALTVVDTGLGTGDVDRIEAGLAQHGWSWEQVKHVLITHAHVDHIGGLAALQKRANAHTWIHRLDAPIARGEQPAPTADPAELNPLERLMLVQINRSAPTPARIDTELDGGEVLHDILPGLEVIHLPGHSYGQCGFWMPEQRALIGGDVIARFFGRRLSLPFRAASPDWEAARRSVYRVAELAPDVLVLGHGVPLRSGAAAAVQGLIDRMA